MPVMLLVGEAGATIVALTGPLIWLQAPVPTVAVFAAIVASPDATQVDRLLPALAAVGF